LPIIFKAVSIWITQNVKQRVLDKTDWGRGLSDKLKSSDFLSVCVSHQCWWYMCFVTLFWFRLIMVSCDWWTGWHYVLCSFHRCDAGVRRR